MKQPPLLDEVLDAAEQLDDQAQAELVSVLSRRLAERGRMRIAASVEQGMREYAAGLCKPQTPEEIMREALN